MLVPIMPDIQITRPKLLTIEILSYLLFVFFVFFVILENKIFYYENRVFYFFILFLFYVFTRYVISEEKPIMFNELKRWILSIFLFYSISIACYKNYNKFLYFFVFGSFLSVIYGFLQHTGGIKGFVEVPKMERVMSMFGNPIFFAVHIINFLPIAAGLLFIQKKFYLKFILLIVCITSFVVLYYTKTRAAFIGIFVGFLFFIYFLFSSKRKLIYLSSLIVIFLVFLFFTRNIWLRHQAHPLIWRDTIKMWLSSPIFGVGFGKFHIEFVKFASEDLRKIWPEKSFIINDAHNEYLQILSESGIVGFVLFLIPIVLFFYEVLKKTEILPQKEKAQKIIILSLLSGCLSVLIQNFFSVDMRFIISNVYLFITMGIIISITEELKEKRLIFTSKEIKIISILIFIFLSGLISFNKGTISFLSIFHISSKKLQLKIDDNGFGLLQLILQPYLANYRLSQEKDFFDEKVIDAAKTLEELKRLKEKYPDRSIIYEKIAWIYAKERQFDMAIQYYLKAIELNPNSYAAYNNLGNIMFYIDRKKAIEYYLKSIDINPNQVDARINLGITYYLEGKLDLASQQFNEVLKIDPNNEKAIVYLKKMRE
ncbi:MAG: tetratricopeptide repeat protein [Endomicrobia bacterium]|nr:tetratricopeptide repeat protein [Endomicrobiia bacterium]